MALLGFIYWNTAGFMARQTDQTLEAEITGLQEQFEQRGMPGLVEIISQRSRQNSESLYLITDARRSWIAGNLRRWPDMPRLDDIWIDFTFEVAGARGPERHQARARQFVIRRPSGAIRGYLLVGRDVNERRAIVQTITSALGWAVALTIFLGLAGGGLMSRNMMQRVEGINRTSRRIVKGDLSQRVPVTGSGDEMDQLGENLNAMLDQIERLMTAMRQVTDNIAHDLRSPLNRLRSRVEVTLMRPPDVADYKRVLEETIVEADGLITTFNALLSITRIESGASGVELVQLVPADIVRDVAELYEPVCEASGQKLITIIQHGNKIYANRELLSQALANLLDNAVKYSTGEVELALANTVDGKVEFSVTDRGPGIPVPDRERVKDRFVRLETSRSQPGSGLGLSLVAAVASLHAAELILSDRAEMGSQGLKASLRFSPASS